MKSRFYLAWATVGGLGFIPIAPGTWTSFVAALVYWFLALIPGWLQGIVFIVVLGVGVRSSTVAEQQAVAKDPGYVVIDEVLGMWIALLTLPRSIVLFLFAFVLFRIFDIVKPTPIRALQKLHGGWGIVLDDLVAGVLAAVILHLGLLIL